MLCFVWCGVAWFHQYLATIGQYSRIHMLLDALYLYLLMSRYTCHVDDILQKGPTRNAYAWQIGPFWQDTLDVWANVWKMLTTGIRQGKKPPASVPCCFLPRALQSRTATYWQLLCCQYNKIFPMTLEVFSHSLSSRKMSIFTLINIVLYIAPGNPTRCHSALTSLLW